MQFSTAVRNARLDAIESTIGTSAILYIRSGAPPSAPTDADSGTLLATIDLPSDWMAAASSGVKTKAGTWQTPNANATGEAGHFRIKDSTGTTTHIQGTVTITGGGGDMTVDNTSIAENQQVTVSTFTFTEGFA